MSKRTAVSHVTFCFGAFARIEQTTILSEAFFIEGIKESEQQTAHHRTCKKEKRKRKEIFSDTSQYCLTNNVSKEV